MLLTRKLLKIEIKNSPISDLELDTYRDKVSNLFGVSAFEAGYFAFKGNIYNRAYNQQEQKIRILRKSGKVLDVMNAWIPGEDVADQMRKTIDANHIIYPVPTEQMDVKEGLYEQNSGYE